MCFRGWEGATPSRRLRRLSQSLLIRLGGSPLLQACAGIVSVVVDDIGIAVALACVQVRVLVIVVAVVVVAAGVCFCVLALCASISATRCLTDNSVM